jgi:hypothetical protein
MLWGLVLLAIPVIIHLFNFRRYRKVFFTNVRQLQEIAVKTRRNARLKNLLVLLLRMTTVAALVLAFAAPFKVDKNQKANVSNQNRLVSIFIDNSFSMESAVGEVSLLDLAKQRALEIVDAYPLSSKFQLLTNDFSGISQRFLNKDAFVEEVQNIIFSPAIRTTREIMIRQKSLLDSEDGIKECFFISDFQKNTVNPSGLEADTSYNIVLMPLYADLHADIFVDSCWFESPVHRQGESNKLFVKLRGIGNEMLQKLPVRLIINNRQAGLNTFDLAPNGETVVEILFTVYDKGVCFASIEVSDYPIIFDDKLFFTFSVAEQIQVVELNNRLRQNYLQSLFNEDEAFDYHRFDLSAIDYSALTQANFVVLSNVENISSGLSSTLEQFVGEGGALAVFPPSESHKDEFSLFLQRFGLSLPLQPDTAFHHFGSLNLQSRFYDEVFERIPDNMDMPSTRFHYYTTPPVGAESIITLTNGAPALIRMPYKNGMLYLFTIPLDEQYSNFPRQALFVPTMLRMALNSLREHSLYYVIGQNEFLSLWNFSLSGETPPSVFAEDGSSFIPGIRERSGQSDIFMHDNIRQAGLYTIASMSDTVHVAFNYDRKESVLENLKIGDIEDIIRENGLNNVSIWKKTNASIAQGLMEMQHGAPLWRWFIIIALLTLLTEGLILRFWK